MKRLTEYSVDMEWPTDPYGEGVGYVVQVLARSAKEARQKAVKAWPGHPYNKGGAYNSMKPFKVCKSKLTVL